MEKYGLKTLFLLFNIKKIENVLLKCLPPCSFTFHTSYKNGMIGHGGGTLSKCSKTLYYKNLLETYFVKACR